MAVKRTYKGTPVIRMMRVKGGILLVLANKRPGDVHPRMVITQQQWDRDGVTTRS